MNRDEALALDRLRGILRVDPDPDRSLVLVHEGIPVAWERAGYNPKSKTFFTPEKTRAAELALAWAFRSALRGRPTFTDTVGIVALFFVPTRRRRDIDNFLKLVLDAATKSRVWGDDSQVVIQAAYIDLDPDHPRTVVALAPCVASLSKTPLLTATGAV